MGSSSPGVKILTRQSVSARSAGRTNVVSEKFISFAIACIVSGASPRASSMTASWLPPKRWSVKTSRCRYRYDFMLISGAERPGAYINVACAHHDHRRGVHDPAVRPGGAKYRRKFRRPRGGHERIHRSQDRQEN